MTMRTAAFVLSLASALLLTSQFADAAQKAASNCVVEGGAEPLVKTEDDALRIGWAMWRAHVPEAKTLDEKTFEKRFFAKLENCAWHIQDRPIPPDTSGNWDLTIGAGDGRYLGMLIHD